MRGFIQKLKYRRRLNELHSHPEEVVKVRYLNYSTIRLGQDRYTSVIWCVVCFCSIFCLFLDRFNLG